MLTENNCSSSAPETRVASRVSTLAEAVVALMHRSGQKSGVRRPQK